MYVKTRSFGAGRVWLARPLTRRGSLDRQTTDETCAVASGEERHSLYAADREDFASGSVVAQGTFSLTC